MERKPQARGLHWTAAACVGAPRKPVCSPGAERAAQRRLAPGLALCSWRRRFARASRWRHYTAAIPRASTQLRHRFSKSTLADARRCEVLPRVNRSKSIGQRESFLLSSHVLRTHPFAARPLLRRLRREAPGSRARVRLGPRWRPAHRHLRHAPSTWRERHLARHEYGPRHRPHRPVGHGERAAVRHPWVGHAARITLHSRWLHRARRLPLLLPAPTARASRPGGIRKHGPIP